jgi:hypothetical protein
MGTMLKKLHQEIRAAVTYPDIILAVTETTNASSPVRYRFCMVVCGWSALFNDVTCYVVQSKLEWLV